MSLENIPYQIQINSNPKRTSFNFLQNADQILENHAKKLNTTASSLSFSRLFSSVRILNGPQPQMKTIAVFRAIRQQMPSSSSYTYFSFMGLYLVDLASPSLQFQVLAERIQPLNTRIRDVAINPNGKQALIICQNQIQKHRFERSKQEKGLQYQLIQQKRVKFANDMSIVDVNFHPNGQFTVGIAYQNITKVQLRPFKLNSTSLQFEFAEDVSGKCMDSSSQFFQYLKKWCLAIDKNKQTKAMIAGYMDTVCILDMATMKVDYFKINREGLYYVIPPYPDTEDTNIAGHSVIGAAGFLNSTNTGYFIAIQPFENHANRFFDGTPNVTLQDVFNFIPSNQTKDSSMAKCIDIYDINTFACIRKDGMNVYFTKLDEERYQTFDLAVISNTRQQKTAANGTSQNSYSNNIQNQIVEQIFYDKVSGQLCQIYDLSVQCFEIKTKCTLEEQWSSINTCNSICQKNGQNNYWNPIKMTCKICTNCTCKRKYSYNPYFDRCALNCSQVDYAMARSQYSNNTKCACQYPLVWFASLQTCRYNCSGIQFADLNADYSSVPAFQCVCLKNYQFISKLGSQTEKGRCMFVCKNGQLANIINGQQYCGCEEGLTWSTEYMKCLGEGTQSVQSKGMPGWGIALLVIFLLLLVGVALFFIRKYIKKRNASKYVQGNIQLPPSSDRQNTKANQFNSLKSTQHNLKGTKTCTICNNDETEVNCQGPCGHFYHFSCIKARMDQGQNSCPQCFKTFQNGLADLKLVQKQEQIWTISQG